MTYKYHADACITYPAIEYDKIRTPFLVACGTRDPLIASCDAFVEKAKQVGAPVDYVRVDGMDHYVRKYPEVVAQTFAWIQKHVDSSRTT